MNKRACLLLMVFLIFAVSAISACAPDPRKEAQAYAIKSEADQTAINNEQVRQQSDDVHNIEIQQLQLDQAHREATAKNWNAAMNSIIKWFGVFGSVAVGIGLIAVAVSFSRASYGLGVAVARAAYVRANLIPLDRVTRQFPLLLQHVHGNRYALHNPNVGSVLMLDSGKDPDRQLIATSGATQIAGVLAQEASRSSDPAGVSMINPPVIDAKDENLLIGHDFIKSLMIPLPGENNE